MSKQDDHEATEPCYEIEALLLMTIVGIVVGEMLLIFGALP